MHIRTVIMLAAALQCACKERRRPGLRVINGQPDTGRRYPYVVALVRSVMLLTRRRLARYCTGTLIAPEWVLTAAHCVDQEGKPPPKQKQRVVYGDLNIPPKKTRQFRIIKKFLNHPEYREWGYESLMRKDRYFVKYDIALVEIDALILKTYGKVSAVDYKSLLGRQVVYAGAGLTLPHKQLNYEKTFNKSLFDRHKIEDGKKPLQIDYGVVMPCDREWYAGYSVQPKVCVAFKCSKKDHGVQKGDSGGPLFYKGRVVGIAHGVLPNVPALYTPISTSLDWIARTVSDSDSNSDSDSE